MQSCKCIHSHIIHMNTEEHILQVHHHENTMINEVLSESKVVHKWTSMNPLCFKYKPCAVWNAAVFIHQ